MEALQQILEVVQFIAALALLYFAFKAPEKVRTLAVLLGVICLLISVPPFYFASPRPDRMMFAVAAISLTTLAIASMAWLVSRLR